MTAYIDRLRSAQSDGAFDVIMRDMIADKRVSLEQARAIASEYVGFEIAKSKGRRGAFQMIADHQALNARQIARWNHQ